MDDRDILSDLRGRNEKALDALFAKYKTYCTAIAFNILRDEQDSEECVNDAILQLWNAPPAEELNSLKNYLAAVVRNLAFDRRKAQNRQKRGGDVRVEALDDYAELTEDETDVESEYEKRALARALNDFLRGLSEKERNVFIRRFYYLEDAKTIARFYGTSKWAVLKMLSRSKEKLKTFLESEGFK